MADLHLERLTRSYGALNAIDDVSLTVRDGEFLTLLGPSGCGKSTTLFSIAGLDQPTSGVIRVGDTVLFDGDRKIFMAPEHRNIGLVFQSYALWPHMTVRENLAFPLKLRKIARAEQNDRISDALKLVEMSEYAERYPFELSGGQQQRVALARALVYRPSLLLLDEPLSNLDAKLRERARVWLRELQEQLRVTTIYVTHDQAEALALSDRIVVMNKGRIRQIGTPNEIYENPADAFVADFIGSSNFLKGEIVHANESWAEVRLLDGSIIRTRAHMVHGSRDVVVAVRPERLEFVPQPEENSVPVQLQARAYLGSVYQYEVACGGTSLRVQTAQPPDTGDVFVRIPPEATKLFVDDEAKA